MFRLLAPLVMAALLVACADSRAMAQPAPAAPQARDNPGEVTARGTARVFRKPDFMDVIIGVETLGGTAGAAYTDCATRMEAVLGAIKGLSLAGVELQTGTVDLSPRYEQRRYEEPAPAKIIGYMALNTVRVRTTDLRAAPTIIDAALKNGANRVDGISFAMKEVLEAREEALRMATKAARRKAEVMADALGYSLGRVMDVSESTMQYGWYSNRSVNMAQVQSSGDSGAAPGGESIEPGKIEIVVDVTLTFTLRPPDR